MTQLILVFAFMLSVTLNLIQEEKIEQFEKICKDMK